MGMPPPPETDLIKWAIGWMAKVIARPRFAVWTKNDLRKVTRAWLVAKAGEGIPSRFMINFFRARRCLKPIVRKNAHKRIWLGVATALGIGIDNGWKDTDLPRLAEVTRLLEKVPTRGRRPRPPWTDSEMRLFGEAARYAGANAGRIPQAPLLNFKIALADVERVARTQAAFVAWQIVADHLEIDINGEPEEDQPDEG